MRKVLNTLKCRQKIADTVSTIWQQTGRERVRRALDANSIRNTQIGAHSLCSLQKRTTHPERGDAIKQMMERIAASLTTVAQDRATNGGLAPETMVLMGLGSSWMVRNTS